MSKEHNKWVQTRLDAHGFPVGLIDGIIGKKTIASLKGFQASEGLEPTGIVDLKTEVALRSPAKPTIIPASWMPDARMQRIVCHWTAGGHKATDFDRKHYHMLLEGDGRLVLGIPSIRLNEAPAKKGYAAHTLNCNSGSIGVSLCCMAGAVEDPFNPGNAPMTKTQWDKLAVVVAELCRRYGIPVTPKTVLSHAEVQANLGIAQRGKWDYTRLAFDPDVKGAKACGDLLRAAVSRHLGENP